MNLDFINYLQRHWRGDLSLTHAFWVNLVLLFFALNYFERFLFPPYIQDESTVTTAVIIFFVTVRLIIYPWQVVGVLRSCDRSVKRDVDRHWIITAQGVVILSLVATLSSSFSSYQSLLQYKGSLIPPETFEIPPKYTFNLVNQGNILHLRGPIQHGITKHFSAFIDDHPQITGVILDSSGGQISEGRGIARIIREKKLNTYCMDRCMSACTTAFAAGVKRTVSTNARLGFHQYQSFTVYPNFDIEEEQRKDIALFKAQGVSDEFLQKIFAHPPEDMWLPEHEELLEANFVHQVGISFSGGRND